MLSRGEPGQPGPGHRAAGHCDGQHPGDECRGAGSALQCSTGHIHTTVMYAEDNAEVHHHLPAGPLQAALQEGQRAGPPHPAAEPGLLCTVHLHRIRARVTGIRLVHQ